MAIPLIAHFVAGGIAGAAAGIFKPTERIVASKVNWNFPNLLPSVSDASNAFWTGQYTQHDFERMLRSNGIDIANAYKSGYYTEWWKPVIEASRPIPSPEEIKHLMYLGLFNQRDAREMLSRHFWGNQDYAILFATLDQPFLLAELLLLTNRGQFTREEFTNALDLIGYHSKESKDRATSLLNEIPGPSDIVHFVLRHGFEPSVIQANRLNEEFPQDAKDWLAKQGLAYEFTITDPFTGQKAQTTWADMYWQTHWVPISPGQAYTMLQRLRPSRIKDIQQLVPGASIFTLEDVKRWLRINDYPPGIRDNLVAISYSPMQTRKVANLYAAGIITQEDVSEYFQDTGLSPRDSNRLARLTVVQEADKKRKTLRENNLAHIKQAYIVGAVSRQMAAIALEQLLLSPTVNYSAYIRLPFPQQSEQAFADPVVIGTLADWDLEIQLDRLKRFIAALKKAFVRGIVSLAGAIDQMTRWGIDQSRQADYLAEWQVDLMASEREVSKGEVIKWYRDGIISLDDAIFRLRNLKYRDSDIAPILGEAQRGILMDLAKAKMAAAKTAEQKRRALLAYQRALVREHRDARAELARHGSVSELGKWYKRGIIDKKTLIKRMESLDWPDRDINLHIKELDLEKTPAEGGPPRPQAAARKPKATQATITKWWRQGIIDEAEWKTRMKDMGYDDDYISHAERSAEQGPPAKGATPAT